MTQESHVVLPHINNAYSNAASRKRSHEVSFSKKHFKGLGKNQDLSTHASNSHIFNTAVANGHGRNLLPVNSLPGISLLSPQNSMSINILSKQHMAGVSKEMSMPTGHHASTSPNPSSQHGDGAHSQIAQARLHNEGKKRLINKANQVKSSSQSIQYL
jgi:hypothetical protein